MVGFCEHGYELSGYSRKFLKQLNNYQLLKEEPAAWS
jgi:hypothetical protein